ncbi:bifunctional serine/threonine-protein kinase/formylglycine-generating enzyme family protein [Dyella sp.]|jgi:non-specific serine/threonine protein kinase|uniref:bifunctional serine/threonine-protein kinase/formylglycine-generating enzyme family protein n=1 Tax=Dyella sp. TaxID=1869338 RepID=UPI002D79B1C0|nr:protein kinase [Dyella sp.]HET6433622.1 protein kinase [Dyella sp.]
MNFLNELIAAFQADKLQLSTLLDIIGSRGPQADDTHRAEVARVEQLGADGALAPEVVEALLARLRAQQQPLAAPPGAIGDADATVVQPAGRAPAGADDATVIQPGARAAAPPADADATVVQAAPLRGPADDEATVVKPASLPGADAQATSVTGSATGTGTSSSFNMDSWQRVADAEGGDYAAVGSVLKGRFHLEKEIGRGGMGVVFLARDERKVEARDRDPYVAVKVLNDDFRRHPDSLIALQRESRRSQSLAHDNIVRVYDFDKDRTIVFMTMEYVDGSDLKQLIREKAYNGMPLAKARPLIEGMAWALKRAHAAGVVHSDFKPGNVMVTRDGVPKVFDFGIARAGKHMGDQVGEQTVFDAGTLGALTPAYASLEMIQGKEPTPSDDIYALGCVTFELLTGKHPFDKVSAEVAMKEGRKPPPVPGLTKRQYQTLCDAVAFTGDKRLKSATELVEGLRDVSLRERAGPYVVFGSIGLVIVAASGWGLQHYLHQRSVDQVVARFALADPQHYTNEDQALGALAALGDDERTRLVIDQGELIQSFLLDRLDRYWNPSQQRYDYAKAQHVFALRDQLKLYSPKLDLRRSAIEQERNELLNQLDTRLAQRIEAGAIFADQPDSAVAILATIRAIDPTSSLLRNAELELKYDVAIGQALAARDTARAREELKQARAVFPDSARLKQRAAQLAAVTPSATAGAAAVASAQGQSVPQAHQALAAAIARPTLDANWRASVTAAMGTLAADRSTQTQQQVAALAAAIAAQVATQSDPLQLPQAEQAVALGLTYAPASAPLLAQRDRLDALQKAVQARLDQESAAAEVTARIESMKRAAAANDVAKAQEALARIRTLQPENDFLAKEGPKLLADAYLGQATAAVQRGRYASASDALARATKVLGNRDDLRQAKARYDLLADIMKARTQSTSAAELARMRQQLAGTRKADPDALAQLESMLKLRGQLPQGNLGDLLDSLRPGEPSPAAGAAAPGAAPAAAPGSTPASGAPSPSTGTRVPPIAGKTTTPATTAAGSTASAGAAAADPCGDPALVGKGRICADEIAGKRGPPLVVVPGVGGGRAYALSRAEVSVNDFNRYCAATRQCAPRPVEDRLSGSLPASNIALSQAKAYAAWLSQSSGFTYRLPSDAEWLAAARAGGSWKQAADSNCVPPSAVADGTGAPISSLGRSPNPWGLVNLTGNVWEWVVSGGAAAVRGASFTSYWSDCTVEAHRADDGSAQNDVGIRLLRELK